MTRRPRPSAGRPVTPPAGRTRPPAGRPHIPPRLPPAPSGRPAARRRPPDTCQDGPGRPGEGYPTCPPPRTRRRAGFGGSACRFRPGSGAPAVPAGPRRRRPDLRPAGPGLPVEVRPARRDELPGAAPRGLIPRGGPATAVTRQGRAAPASYLHPGVTAERVTAMIKPTDRDGAPPIPAVGYARRSSESQDEASIPDQQKHVRQYAAERGYRILRWYTETVSGDDTNNRTEFLRMCDDATALGDFKAILCWDQDRFGRFDS